MASFVLLRVVSLKKTPLLLPCSVLARVSPVCLLPTVMKYGRSFSISSTSRSFPGVPSPGLPSPPHVTQDVKDKEEKEVEKEVVKNKEEEVVKKMEQEQQVEKTFAELLRSSKLVSSGEIVGKCIPALITAVTGKDLYVDFGAKFHAVVPRPEGDASKWRRGVWVEVKVNDLELTQHFLGSSRHTSLLEADVELIGLLEGNN